jgi:hypothetical protein
VKDSSTSTTVATTQEVRVSILSEAGLPDPGLPKPGLPAVAVLLLMWRISSGGGAGSATRGERRAGSPGVEPQSPLASFANMGRDARFGEMRVVC